MVSLVVSILVLIPVGARAWLRAPNIRGMVDRTLNDMWASFFLVSVLTQCLLIALGPVLAATLVLGLTFYRLWIVLSTTIRLCVGRTAGALLLKNIAEMGGLLTLRMSR